MCAIAGIIGLGARPVPKDRIKSMCDAMAHRGPDDAGYAYFRQGGSAGGRGGSWCAFTDDRFRHFNEHLPPHGGTYCQGELSRQEFDLTLGHRRLAIIDLSPDGHQPMSNSDRSLWISFNGEIYNYRELRAGLTARGRAFRTQSDTEVILQGWEEAGKESLRALDGMFAFALYDRNQGLVTLARDRFGVKPLYYARTAEFLVFASEIKGILASGLIPARLDPSCVAEYMTFQNLYGDRTLFEGIKILPPGCRLQIPVGRPAAAESPKPYVRPFHEAAAVDLGAGAVARTSDLFEEAVRRQLVADVPVGAYLSGGMDSGSIVAVAGRAIPRLLTFTGGFDMTNVNGLEQGFDERALAEKLSYLLQTEHYDVVLHAGDMPAAMEKLTWHMDDPRCGMCHPVWYTAKLASRFVKVCLAGGGGDELFGGYPWRYKTLTEAQGEGNFEERAYRYWHRLLPPERMSQLLSPDLAGNLSTVRERFGEMLGEAPPDDPGLDREGNDLRKAFYIDYATFLPGLLIVEDRMSAAHSMETRVPFLDNALASHALSLPPRDKVGSLGRGASSARGGPEEPEGKLVLRRAMEKFLPPEYTRQKKQGFSPPDANWYRGPSMDYLRQILLDPVSLRRPWFDPRFVEKALDEHFQGKQNHRLLVWSLLSLEWLQRHFLDKAS